jgi:hypothetical protein
MMAVARGQVFRRASAAIFTLAAISKNSTRMQAEWRPAKKLNHVVMTDSNNALFGRHFTRPREFGETEYPAEPGSA